MLHSVRHKFKGNRSLTGHLVMYLELSGAIGKFFVPAIRKTVPDLKTFPLPVLDSGLVSLSINGKVGNPILG